MSQAVATRRQRSDRKERAVRVALIAAAGLSMEAAILHLVATPEHFRAWWGYGAFFVAMAVGQALYALVIVRTPSQPMLLLGAAVNAAIIVLYVITRTSGIPLIGPHAGIAEYPGVLDMSATAMEVGLVAVLVTLLEGIYRRVALNTVLTVGAALWVLRFAGVLVWPYL
jgi:hypothetical protein